MSSTLFIRLGQSPEQDVSWFLAGPDGEALGNVNHGRLAAAAAQAAERKIVVLLPGMETVINAADIPVRGTSRQLQVAPYALEEQLADDIGQMHFAVGARREDGKIPVAAISLSVFQEWMDKLGEVGIQPYAVYSELQGLPDIPGAITAMVEPGKIMIRLPTGESFSVDPVMLDTVLGTAGKVKNSDPEATLARAPFMVYMDSELVDEDKLWIQKLRTQFPDAEFRQMAAGALPQLAAGLSRKGAINLLQGAFARKSDWQRAIKPWRLPAALAACLLLVISLTQAASLWRLSKAEAQLDAALEIAIQQVFPGNTRINDPRRQLNLLRQSMGGQSSGSSSQFLDTVVALGSVLPTLQNSRVEAASYRNQVLDMRIMVPDVTTLDQLQKKMEDQGLFKVTIRSANPRADGVEGQIEIARSSS
jgi:general secretion pathway protein L